MFRWADLFLGPDKWAHEPYFSNSINIIDISVLDRYIVKISGMWYTRALV